MTENQKTRIEKMRHNGMEFRDIASAVGMTDAAVRMYCTRHDITPLMEKESTCLFCGNPIERKDRGRKALFCSETCRVKHWRMLQKSDGGVKICKGCGKEFRTANSKGKYCSHGCYIRDRFGGE